VTSTDELLTLGAVELAALLREHTVSSVEVVEAHLRRVEETNAELNAVIALSSKALDDARTADAALARGERGAFLGVPFTVKDWIEAKGLPCAAGQPARAGFVPEEDAPVVARMRRAGAILLGKTNVTDGGGVHPRPNNPHDSVRTPGSSSSGEAAVVAAGGSPIGLASDSGGSIRWPAHCCGVAALKPTTGLVPLTGHVPRIGHISDPRTTIGPMARSARDLEAVLAVIAGEDAGDPSAVPVPLRASSSVELRALRVAWFVEFPGASPTPETASAVEDAARALAERGCKVEPATPPLLEESLPITEAYWARVQSTSFEEWRPPWRSRLTADEIEESRFRWERFTRAMWRFMERYDAVLSPVAARPAPHHDDWGRLEYLYTLPYSLTRQPAAVVPYGRSPEELPIGVQIAARAWQDHVALTLAVALEDAHS
jgi:amidase